MSPPAEHRLPRSAPPIVAFAVDLDRTLLRPGSRSLSRAARVLTEVRGLGLKVVLASGRDYAQLSAIARRLRVLDALVAENGAVVEAPIGRPERVVGWRAGSRVRRRIDTAWPDVDVEYGKVVASVPRSMGRRLRRILSGLPVDLVPNVDRLMVLPHGFSKATGMRIALRALGLGSGSFAAIGDAENDIALLRAAALSGAVGNAQPRVRAVADHACRAAFDKGVAEFVRGPLTEYVAATSPARE